MTRTCRYGMAMVATKQVPGGMRSGQDRYRHDGRRWRGWSTPVRWLVAGVLTCFAVEMQPLSAGAQDVELLGSGLESVLSPGSRLLRPGIHVHDCGDTIDLYVTEKVSLMSNTAMAARKARLGAIQTLIAFVDGSKGTREQDVARAETLEGGEAVSMSVRHRVKVSGAIARLRDAARVTDGTSSRMVFVLPLSRSFPTAVCPP